MKTIQTLAVLMLLTLAAASALEIDSPEEKTYSDGNIGLDIDGDKTYDKLYYRIDKGQYILACANCSDFLGNLSMQDGEHTLKVKAVDGNETDTESVEFVVDTQLGLEILAPSRKTYITNLVPLSIKVDEPADVNYKLNNGPYIRLCENCTSVNATLNLSERSHTLTIQAMTESKTITKSVSFKVSLPDEDDDDEDDQDDHKDNDSNETRYDTGFEKLPQLVESGKISDEELAKIIRDNKLNPGILNRLIKTGKLGNNSLEAILDTQKQPQGIFKKLLSFIGIKQDTYSSLIYENYNLSEKLGQKMVSRDDLPKGYAKKLTENLGKATEQKIKKNFTEDNESQGKFKVGKQVPPGQAKKN